MICNSNYNKPTVFITNDPIKMPATKIIMDNTDMYKFAYVYDMNNLRNNKIALLSFCN